MTAIRIVDTHGHLEDEAFDGDRQAAYERAAAAGVGVIMPGVDVPSSRAARDLAATWSGAWALVGVHPHEAGRLDEGGDWLRQLREMAAHPMVVGVGEIGLDYYRSLSGPARQQDVFRAQLALAHDLNMPVSVHSREAEADTLAALGQAGVSGVLHCFTGSRAMASRLLDMGFYLSFSGVLTFRNADAIRDVARWAPMDRVLVETDAPYMAPVPHRGRRNEPGWVVETAAAWADLRALDAKEGFAILTENSYQAFSRLQKP